MFGSSQDGHGITLFVFCLLDQKTRFNNIIEQNAKLSAINASFNIRHVSSSSERCLFLVGFWVFLQVGVLL